MNEHRREYYKLWLKKNREKQIAYHRAYYLSHREKQRQRDKQNYILHREQFKDKSKRYYLANKDRISKRSIQYRQRHKSRIQLWQREYRQNNLEMVRRREREYYKKFMEIERVRNRSWKKLHKSKVNIYNQRRRVWKRNCIGSITFSEWKTLVEKYGYQCLRCKSVFPLEKLTIDHVIPLSKNGSGSIENIQPLCNSCNCSKQDNTTDYRTRFSPC